jgi:hypothetical protein
VFAVCGLAACTGGDDAAPPSTSTTPVTTLPPATAPPLDLSLAFFEALASAPVTESTAVSAALPGSEAAIYAEHQESARRLLGLVDPRTLAVADQSFEICEPDGGCRTFGGVVSDPDTGRLASFSIDGVPLTGRIVGGGPSVDRDGLIAEVRSAYRSIDGDLFVVTELANGTDVGVEMFGFAAVFEPDRVAGSVEATGAWGTATVEPGATTELLLLFASSEIGGQLRLTGLRADGLDISLVVQVPTA